MSQIAHNLEDKPRTDDVIITEHYSFKSFLLLDNTLKGLNDAGFHIPSPIQVKAIPLGKCGLDLIIQSKSGTGKTAVFSIIALEMIDVEKNDLQVLILAPTREIVVQVENVIRILAKYITGLRTEFFIGGLPIEGDIKKAKTCHIAVGAPGRIKHLLENGHLKSNFVKLFVLDEADKLMNGVFESDIDYINSKMSARKQIIALSATVSEDLDNKFKKLMHLPTFVTPKTEIPVLLGIRQFATVVSCMTNNIQKLNDKVAELIRLLSKISFTQCVVFFNFQTLAESVSNMLNSKGWKNMYMSGAQPQKERLMIFSNLQHFKCRVLMTTDLSARGIDISNIDLVINYDVPYESETYLHRMGRAGRYGSEGLCITIISDDQEMKKFQHILGKIGGNTLNVPKLPIDTFPEDIWKINLKQYDFISAVVDETQDIGNEKTLGIEGENKSVKSCNKAPVMLLNGNAPEGHNREYLCKTADFSDFKINDKDANAIKKRFASKMVSDDSTVQCGSNMVEKLTCISDVKTNETPTNNGVAFNVLKKRKILKEETSKENAKLNTVDIDTLRELLSDNNVNNTAAITVIENLKSVCKKTDETTRDMLKYFQSQECDDILKNLEEYKKLLNDSQMSDQQNIFKLGYDYIFKKGLHWIEALGDKYVPPERNTVVESSDDKSVEMEENEFQQYYEPRKQKYWKRNTSYNHSAKKRYNKYTESRVSNYKYNDSRGDYNLAENYYNHNSSINNSNYLSESYNVDYKTKSFVECKRNALEKWYGPYYGTYFNRCNQEFMNNISNLRDVSSLNYYFNRWQLNSQSVRDYVQQNIYMDIMQEWSRYYQHS